MTTTESPPDLVAVNESQLLFREARQRRKRRWLVAGIASLAFVVLLGIILSALAIHSGGGSPRPVTNPSPAPPAASMPKEMVVWRDFKIEVIASANGQLVRTLAPDPGLFRGVPAPSISPDGTVYFDRGAEPTPGVPITQIVSVPLRGGPTSIVAQGHDPVVSPNGNLLAYLDYVDITGAPPSIVVRDVRTGKETAWQSSSSQFDINGLSWSPDSASLAFTVIRPSADKASGTVTSQVIDVSTPPVALDRAPLIPLPQGMSFAGYINPNQGIGVAQRRDAISRATSFQLSIVDVRSGHVVRRLPPMAGSLAVGNVYDGAEGTVQVDQSGQHLALVGAGTGSGSLSTWTITGNRGGSQTSPIHLANRVISVAWGPLR
jgi:WD40 repeat protein